SPSYYTSSYFKLGSDQVSNTSINCQLGTESDLAECRRLRSTNCGQGSAAAVNCTGSINGRLAGGAHNMEGRLLISNRATGQWYRVCTDVWNDKEATMYCTLTFQNIKGQLKGRVIRSSAFDQQSGSFVFLSRQCNGISPFCIFEVNSTNVCPYSDIAMSCTSSELDAQHSIRLVNGHDEYEGRVEIKFNNTWYTLCDNNWDANDAAVLCRSLGYWVSSSTAYSDAWFGQGSVPSTNPYLSCNSLEPTIFDCSTSYPWGPGSCSHSDDAGVRCQPGSLGRDKIRLVDGPGPWKGKLEVFYNNQWGGFCMNKWNQINTEIVCRMLLFKLSSPTSYVFNGTRTMVSFGELQCAGNETDIGLCKAFSDINNCTDDVVGIDCSGRIKYIAVVITSQNFARTVYAKEHSGIQAHLLGGNSSMGYAQIQEHGSWNQICSSGWNSDEANVFYCYYEYTNNTGIVVSPNYPSYYPPNWSCLYNIRPHGPSRSGFYTLTFTTIYLYNVGDEVELRHRHTMDYL
ncbi:hypothetical protein CHS0354_012592, partial [Potamilus streckersoni]